MIITGFYRQWTKGTQTGIRFHHNEINKLVSSLNVPDRRNRHRDLSSFITQVLSGAQPKTYSRRITIVKHGKPPIKAFMTISHSAQSHKTQAHITAPKGTWFETLVLSNLTAVTRPDYLVIGSQFRDILLIP